MTRYLLANLAGAILLVGGSLGLLAAAIVLLDGWQLVGATSALLIAGGVRLARLDGGDA